jgi:hypothetical protein
MGTARIDHRASGTYPLRISDLRVKGITTPDGEEDLGVEVAARRVLEPFPRV